MHFTSSYLNKYSIQNLFAFSQFITNTTLTKLLNKVNKLRNNKISMHIIYVKIITASTQNKPSVIGCTLLESCFTYEASTEASVSIRSFIFSKSALLGGLLVAPSCGSLTSAVAIPNPPGSEGVGGPGLKCDLINCKHVRRPCTVHWLYNNFWRCSAPKDKVWPINCKYVGRQLNCVVFILLM